MVDTWADIRGHNLSTFERVDLAHRLTRFAEGFLNAEEIIQANEVERVDKQAA